MTLHLEKEIADAWRGDDPFVHAQQQRGEIFRDKEGRRTLRFALDAAHGDVNKKTLLPEIASGHRLGRSVEKPDAVSIAGNWCSQRMAGD